MPLSTRLSEGEGASCILDPHLLGRYALHGRPGSKKWEPSHELLIGNLVNALPPSAQRPPRCMPFPPPAQRAP